METTTLLQQLLRALDAESVDESRVAWKALQKAAGELVKPWAPLLTFKHSWCPPANALLQRGLTEGGQLRALVEETVRQHPRELWELVQEIPLKGIWWLRDHHGGAEPRLITRQHKKAFCLYDPRDLSLVETLKPTSLTQVVFAEDGGLRATEGAALLTRGPGEKRWKKVHEFNEASSIALGPRLAAVVETVVTQQGDDATEHHELHVFSFETGKATRHRLDGTGFGAALVAGLTAVVGSEGRVLISENGAAPTTRPLPADLSTHELVDLEGTRWLNTSRKGAIDPGPWLRFDDLTEGPFGLGFEGVHAAEGSVWARNGERVLAGQRTRPIWFDATCRGVVALSTSEIIAVRSDTKDKQFFVRFKRFS